MSTSSTADSSARRKKDLTEVFLNKVVVAAGVVYFSMRKLKVAAAVDSVKRFERAIKPLRECFPSACFNFSLHAQPRKGRSLQGLRRSGEPPTPTYAVLEAFCVHIYIWGVSAGIQSAGYV